MPGNAEDAESIRNAYRNGDLTEEEIRSCAGRILELISQLAWNCYIFNARYNRTASQEK